MPLASTFPAHVYAARLSRAQSLLHTRSLAAVIIAPGPELAYLTGSWTSSHERLTALVVTKDGDARLLAPATDAAAVAHLNQIPGLTVCTWRDGEDPYARIVNGLAYGPVAFGSALTADHVLRLQEALGAPGQTIVASDALPELFMVKDAAEIEQLHFAAHAIDAVHKAVPNLLVPGRTELQVAADLKELILREHAQVDFVIVGSGPHGANPHHEYSDRVLEDGDPVVVDIGGTVGAGYHSDCTRTYVVGGIDRVRDPEFHAAYGVLRAAQNEAVATARPGMTAGELDAVARGVIARAGYGERFSHRLGHGIGLGLHEPPFVVAGNDVVLSEGMVFSIEPGIYIPGRWGMRIEDIVVLEDGGARSLNTAPRTLIAVGQ